MILQPLKFSMNELYRWRRDAQYSSRDRWVLQRTCIYTLYAFAAGEQDLDTPVATLLNNVLIRQPATTFMNTWHVPSLTSAPNTLYSRADYVSGSDYELLPDAAWEWRVTTALHRFSDTDRVTNTHFNITGRWDKYQGVVYGVQRSEV